MVELLLLIGFVALGYIGYQTWSRSQTSTGQPAGGPADAGMVRTVEAARPGGVIQIPPYGEDREEQDVQIKARHIYRQGNYEWYELECDSGSGTVWLEVERDDELEANVTLKRLSLDDLGLTASSLSDAKPPAKTVSFEGQTFRFSEYSQARYLPEGDSGRAQDVSFWDFEGDDERHDLSIERWGSDDCRAYLSERINPDRIRIYSLGGTA